MAYADSKNIIQISLIYMQVHKKLQGKLSKAWPQHEPPQIF